MITGGCQCGALRYAISGPLGRASICHCRMCQKAVGGPIGAYVDAPSLVWTRGEPSHFQSSAKVRRGFCRECGTPLTFEWSGAPLNVAFMTLDDPSIAPPTIQVGTEGLQPWMHHIADLPVRADADAPWLAGIRSSQHPDHDTTAWPPGDAPQSAG